jgi:hypothetical protein
VGDGEANDVRTAPVRHELLEGKAAADTDDPEGRRDDARLRVGEAVVRLPHPGRRPAGDAENESEAAEDDIKH